MHIEEWFLEQLPAIERAISFVCHRYQLRDEEREDFASTVKLKLIENDYAILRKFEQRSSFGTFMVVTVKRMLLDKRVHEWGKWHPSAEAKRMGEAAIELEKLLVRDERPLEQVAPVITGRFGLTRERVVEIAALLPERRPRPVAVAIDEASERDVAQPASDVESNALSSERRRRAQQIESELRAAFDAMEPDDRRLLRLRFLSGMSVAEIARATHADQKQLYRRIEKLLAIVRERLAGIRLAEDDLAELFDHMSSDFASPLRNAALRPSTELEPIEGEGVSR